LIQNLPHLKKPPNIQVWKDAMIEEYESILKNDVWAVVPRPHGKSVVTSKWLYKIKPTADGSIEVKFVTRDFSQKEGIIYDKILTSIRIFISLVAVFDLETSPDRC
jgi:hypothetical protein